MALLPVIINKLHRAYWFITRPKTRGVKALIFNNNKVLMVRLTYYPNTWTFPGGGVDGSESIEQAIIRECLEEVGIELKNPSYIGNLEFNYEYKKDALSVFKATVINQQIVTDPKEIAEANWFALDNLPVMGKNAKAILEFAVKNR
jgi:mutator protein MutT